MKPRVLCRMHVVAFIASAFQMNSMTRFGPSLFKNVSGLFSCLTPQIFK